MNVQWHLFKGKIPFKESDFGKKGVTKVIFFQNWTNDVKALYLEIKSLKNHVALFLIQ